MFKPLVSSITAEPYIMTSKGVLCKGDPNVYLSLRVYPIVVRQVGDVVNWYFKITNLTGETIKGPIDFYMSGSKTAIAEIDQLPPFGYYDLLIEGKVTELDITRKFIVATVWARLRNTRCLLGNVVESEVAVEQVQDNGDNLEFANPILIVNATETTINVKAGIDIINLGSSAVDSLILDLSVIFGTEAELSYLINGLPSNIFTIAGGVLTLTEGQHIAANSRFSLLVTNVNTEINLDGLCDQSCRSTVSWRFEGNATRTTSVAWQGTSLSSSSPGFSAVKVETGDPIQLGSGVLAGWGASPQLSSPMYNGTFNDGGFNEITGIYTVITPGRYLLTACLNLLYQITLGPSLDNDYLQIIVDNNPVAAAEIAQVVGMEFIPPLISETVITVQNNITLQKLVYLNAGAKVILSATLSNPSVEVQYVSNPTLPLTFAAAFLGT